MKDLPKAVKVCHICKGLKRINGVQGSTNVPRDVSIRVIYMDCPYCEGRGVYYLTKENVDD